MNNPMPFVEQLVAAIRSAREGRNVRSFDGLAAANYDLKEFLLRTSQQAEVEMLDALHDEDPFVRWCVVKALGCRISSMESLISALDDSNEDVRAQAVLELGSMQTPQVVEALLLKLEDDSELVKEAAAASLPIVTGKSFFFGKRDSRKWRSWWRANEAEYLTKPIAPQPAAAASNLDCKGRIYSRLT